MMDAPCMTNLIQLTGLQRAPKKKGVTIRGGGAARPKKTVTATYTLATTTPLVSLVFEECFSEQVNLRFYTVGIRKPDHLETGLFKSRPFLAN